MKNLLKLFGFVFLVACTLVFTSCEKTNIDEIIEEVEEIEEDFNSTITMEFQGNTTTINASAAYCNQNGHELLYIMNNPVVYTTANGDTSVFPVLENDGDYMIFRGLSPLNPNPYVTVDFVDVDSTQSPPVINRLSDVPTFSFAIDTVLNTVTGTASGTFTNIATGASAGNYSINFNASIDANLPLCN